MTEFFTYISNSMFITNLLLVVFLVGFGYLFLKESNNPTSPLQWSDMLIDKKTNKLSLGQLGQFVGIVIGAWMMMFLVQVPAAYSIIPLVFPMWLAFLGGAYAYSKYMSKTDTALKLNIDDKDKAE